MKTFSPDLHRKYFQIYNYQDKAFLNLWQMVDLLVCPWEWVTGVEGTFCNDGSHEQAIAGRPGIVSPQYLVSGSQQVMLALIVVLDFMGLVQESCWKHWKQRGYQQPLGLPGQAPPHQSADYWGWKVMILESSQICQNCS